ncbi:hypothetical protein [Thermincola potens]|uniref:Uncharacterized protein n=1 Tax=Thermincola potens (strain JR) TaxID=635013 RepID=D5XC21_THEPJ|nr:hypothetical protein [Thermincola potens]ADG83473.1 hypothetical protein TherJR_2637 [Thermincola potens JR]
MNKKLMAILGTVAVGGVLLGTTAFAAISGTSGYDVYKEALKNTYAVNSITPKTEVTVKDNGKLLFKVDAISKLDKEKESMSNSVTVTSGGLQKTVDMYRQDNKTVIKSSDSSVYNVLQRGRERNHKKEWREDDPGRIKDIENVADALTGTIQNYITLNSNPDGTKEVALQLSDKQISPIINAVASLMVKNLDKELKHMGNKPMDFAFENSLQDKLPRLVDNIRVSHIDVEAKINKDNLIQEQTENITITGTDAKGNAHEVVINIDTGFSNYNSTTPDTVDLSGKQVNIISPENYRHEK